MTLTWFVGPGPNDQLLRIGSRRDPSTRDRRPQRREHRIGSARGQRVDYRFGRRRFRLFLAHLFDGRLDQDLIVRSGHGNQLLGIGADAEGCLGKGAAQNGNRGRRRGRLQRVDHALWRRVGRFRLGHLLDKVVNLLVLARLRPNDQLARVGPGGESRQGEDLGQAPRRRIVQRPFEAVDDQFARVVARRLLDQLVDNRLDLRLVGRSGPDEQLVGRATDAGIRARGDLPDHGNHRRGGHVLQFVHGRLGRGLGRLFGRELVDDLLYLRVLGGASPNVQLIGVRAWGDLCLGSRLADDGKRRAGSRVFEGIDHQRRFGLGRLFRGELVEDLLYLRMVGRSGPRPSVDLGSCLG